MSHMARCMIKTNRREGRQSVDHHPILPSFAALAARVEAPTTTDVLRSHRRRYTTENENALRVDLFCRKGRRSGGRPRRGEWIYRAKLRGDVIKIEKFSFIANWCWCMKCGRNNNVDTESRSTKKAADNNANNRLQLSALTNGASANASPPIRALSSERNEEISEQRPLLLLPPLPNVAPESVLKKLNSKKRLHSDASMALATLHEEAVRALVELSSKDKEDDLRLMMGAGYRRLRRIPRKQAAIETNPSIARGVFPGDKDVKRLKYK